MSFWTSESAVDLSGRTFRNKGLGQDIVIVRRTPEFIVEQIPGPGNQLIKNIHLHNGGLIGLRTFDGVKVVGLGGELGYLPVSMPSDIAWHYEKFPEQKGVKKYEDIANKNLKSVLAELPATKDYGPRGIVLENLRIRVSRYGVVVQGAGTIIRNCIIEVDAGAAVYLFGSNGIIENNTLIVNGNGFQAEGDAPIRLHQGDGTVIRNNQIVLRKGPPKQAITLVSSKDVIATGNRVYGTGLLYRAFDPQSALQDRENRLLPLSDWKDGWKIRWEEDRLASMTGENQRLQARID